MSWITQDEVRACERISLCDVVRQLVDSEPQSETELLTQVHEDWGACTAGELRAALRQLVSDRLVVNDNGAYARRSHR